MSETRELETLESSPPPPSEPVAPPADRDRLCAEVRAVHSQCVLARGGSMRVFVAHADAIPHLLYEIGRLRELTFRAVGEGTGRRIDLDWFDSHYLHLVLWNDERGEVVGSYRCGTTDTIVPRFGVDGLYTSTLFAYRDELVARLVPGLELGRSFVRPEYQKTYSALLLLWRAIGEFVVRSPRYRLLFGAVSVSNDFRPRAQQRIVEFLREVAYLPGLGRFVRSRSPLGDGFRRSAAETSTPRLEDLAALEREVFDIERGERGVPVLLKQYLKLGGRVLGFARDPDFHDSLDTLVLVDLAVAPIRVLARYLGGEGVHTFLEYHRPPDLRRDAIWPRI
jgi:Acetyltransferase (GNAT) domain